MYHKYFPDPLPGDRGPSPTVWEPLGGIFTSPPAAVSWGPGRLDVFGLGTDNQIYTNYFNDIYKDRLGGGWGSDWERLVGGVFDSAPAVVAYNEVSIEDSGEVFVGRVDVFGRGLDKQVYFKLSYGGSWGYPEERDWEPLGSVSTFPTGA